MAEVTTLKAPKAHGLVKDVVSAGLREGVYIVAKYPWRSGILAKKAAEHKIPVKYDYIIRLAPPWANSRFGVEVMSKAQKEVITKFARAILEAREAGILGRAAEGKKLAFEVIKEKMYTGKPRVFKSRAMPIEKLREKVAYYARLAEVAPPAVIKTA